MKIDKTEKIIIVGLTILILTAVVSTIFERKKAIRNHISPTYINDVEENDLPKDIKELSQKYQAYEDLYKSDNLTLVYSYISIKDEGEKDLNFHKQLSENLKNENLNINVIALKNWEDDTFEISLKNNKYIEKNAESCSPATQEEEKLQDFIAIAQHCINNVCLVDVKNHKYTLISPNPDFIIETIKNYKL